MHRATTFGKRHPDNRVFLDACQVFRRIFRVLAQRLRLGPAVVVFYTSAACQKNRYGLMVVPSTATMAA